MYGMYMYSSCLPSPRAMVSGHTTSHTHRPLEKLTPKNIHYPSSEISPHPFLGAGRGSPLTICVLGYSPKDVLLWGSETQGLRAVSPNSATRHRWRSICYSQYILNPTQASHCPGAISRNCCCGFREGKAILVLASAKYN